MFEKQKEGKQSTSFQLTVEKWSQNRCFSQLFAHTGDTAGVLIPQLQENFWVQQLTSACPPPMSQLPALLNICSANLKNSGGLRCISWLQRRWLGIACSIIQDYRHVNVYGVSSETGVSRGLAASALLQQAKLQRHFLGAAANWGNRGLMLSSATWRQLIRLLLKFYRPHILNRNALLFRLQILTLEH